MRSSRARIRVLAIVAAIAVFIGIGAVTSLASASTQPLDPTQFVFFRG